MKKFLGLGLLVLGLSAVATAQEGGPFTITYDKFRDQTTISPNYKSLVPNILMGGPPKVMAFAAFKGDKMSGDTLFPGSLMLLFVFHTHGIIESYSSAQETVFFVDGKKVELGERLFASPLKPPVFKKEIKQITPGPKSSENEWFEIFYVQAPKELIEIFASAKSIESRFRRASSPSVAESPYAEFLITQEDTKYLRAFLDLLKGQKQ